MIILTLTNVDRQSISVPEPITGAGRIEVTTTGGVEPQRTEASRSRLAGPRVFKEIGAKESSTQEFDLRKRYVLRAGAKYTVRFSFSVLSDGGWIPLHGETRLHIPPK